MPSSPTTSPTPSSRASDPTPGEPTMAARRRLTPDQAVAALALANQQPPRIRTMPDHPALESTPLQQCIAALRMLLATPGIVAHLRANTPMALEQAERALYAAGYAAGEREVIEAAPTRQEGAWTALRELDGQWTGLGPLD